MSLSQILQPRICELGKIKIGGLGEARKSRSGNDYRTPVKYDHFRVTTLHRDGAGGLIEDLPLMQSLAHLADPDGQLRRLPISLLSNDEEEVLQASYLWYNGRRLAGKSDGQTCTIYFQRPKAKGQEGTWLAEPKVMNWDPAFATAPGPDGKPLFKLHCTLNAVIASPMARWGGLYKFRTTSRITADQLYGSLVQLKQLTGGILRGLPLQLVVRPIQVAPDGKPTIVYVVHCELLGSDIASIQKLALERAQFELSSTKQLMAAQAEYRKLLAAPDSFADGDDEEETGQEFHPHQQPGQPGHYPATEPPAIAAAPAPVQELAPQTAAPAAGPPERLVVQTPAGQEDLTPRAVDDQDDQYDPENEDEPGATEPDDDDPGPEATPLHQDPPGEPVGQTAAPAAASGSPAAQKLASAGAVKISGDRVQQLLKQTQSLGLAWPQVKADFAGVLQLDPWQQRMGDLTPRQADDLEAAVNARMTAPRRQKAAVAS